MRAVLEAVSKQKQDAAQRVADRLQGVTVTLARPAAETGMLYGTIRPRDIAEALEAMGHTDIERSSILIGAPIKALGEHSVAIELHAEVQVKLPVTVERQSS